MALLAWCLPRPQWSRAVQTARFRLQSSGRALHEETQQQHDDEEFRVLNLNQVKNQRTLRRKAPRPEVPPPRSQQMATDQDWGAVWPGPRSFQPATVPLPLRQGYVTKRNQMPPGKYANAELMKIPNFLHLTPPVIKRQCEALKQFCTPWPKGLETEERMEKHFPVTCITADYCHALPTIRNPLSRIVTVQLKLGAALQLDRHAKDKMLRLVGERYDAETDVLTIVTDRCPLKKQNYDYAIYLLTALYHESNTVEPWEATKGEADMEYYDFERNRSKRSAEATLNWGRTEGDGGWVMAPAEYASAVTRLFNEGENAYNLEKYKEQSMALLGLSVAKGE
ncbi:28S ribosomal protein S35, mitochondrial isoform X2 [Anopheles cruzii]|uniref:28S ribosomal protein S35, mitochondrial isoform X1 n=1 Tax=Anopheles cruzii TaxID=68878 RepID=UPI0022EC17A7|nr:28S ribosomal protein S35, mitochondrial isoform X1 [Anopheles cruzii]XP_052860134.1 28S ribosomal protein S35, mitochondrial isoform X2 [Anopheles cruzii]